MYPEEEDSSDRTPRRRVERRMANAAGLIEPHADNMDSKRIEPKKKGLGGLEEEDVSLVLVWTERRKLR